jgi:hypothetical protein
MNLPIHERAVNGNATDAAVLRFGDSVGLTSLDVENEFLGRFWVAVQGEHPLVL